jgi:hypothetical protein
MAPRNVLGIAFGFLSSFSTGAQSVSDTQTFASIRAAVHETIPARRDASADPMRALRSE